MQTAHSRGQDQGGNGHGPRRGDRRHHLPGILLVALASAVASFHPPVSARSEDASRLVHVGVLSLFHPRQLTVTAPLGQALQLNTGSGQWVLDSTSGTGSVTLSLGNDSVVFTVGTLTLHAPAITITGRGSAPADFLLSVPQTLTRQYSGRLEVRPSNRDLLAIVTMDRETAVASVLAAEMTAGTPLEALKAQAIAIRSYLVAGRGRHLEFDFCDTTHCQFLREAPPPGSLAARAAAATRGLVLAYGSQPFAAMYTRSCSGHTHTPSELHLPSSAYPYYGVECPHCLAHPVRWTTRIPSAEADRLRPRDEHSRLEMARRFGWASVPSNDFTVRTDGNGSVFLSGTGQGHGIGLCQSGARAMAEQGATFQQILAHYYPNTAILSSPG